MLKSLKKHAWKPVAVGLVAYSVATAADFIDTNANLETALKSNNGDTDTACRKHLSALRLTQSGWYATTDSMSITKTPPAIKIDMDDCKTRANKIKTHLQL